MGREAKARAARRFPDRPPAQIVNIAAYRSKRQPLQADRKVGVFVAVPTIDGNVHYSIPISFAKMMQSNSVAECPFLFTVHIEAGKRGPDYARNCIVKTFLEDNDADWLVMIDADQGVPDDFWKLCTVLDADVVAAVTPVWVGNMSPETMMRINHYGVDSEGRCFNLQTPPDTAKQPYRVPAVGTGCIAIRRRVFAPKPAGVGTSPFYFTYEDDRKVRGGEDINFSVDCQRAGFVVAAHPEVWFDHVKPLSLKQVEDWYKARHKMEMEGRTTTDEQRLSIG